MTIRKVLFMVLLFAFALPANATNIVIQNNDDPGEGFNNPTQARAYQKSATNTGNTLGELRLEVAEAAAEVLEGIVNSTITITVGATFDDLDCFPSSATLGLAGATSTAEGFIGSDPGVAFHIALAESLSKSNQNDVNVEINARFNRKLDTYDVNCMRGRGFYYGLDDNGPDDTTALFPVVLHELAHGLGFSSLVDKNDGSFRTKDENPDAFSRNLFDLDTGKSWVDMNDAERSVSLRGEPNLLWNGKTVTDERSKHLGPAPELLINAPPPIAGAFEAILGEEPSIVLPENGVTGTVLDGNAFEDTVFEDPDDPDDDFLGPKEDPFEGCTQSAYGDSYTGEFVLFDKSSNCSAVTQAFFAQIEGAIGLIIAATTDSGLPDMSGTINNQDITIPYVGVEKTVGAALRANLASANVTIRNSTTVFMGENQGMVKMHAPDTVETFSSVSHWSKTATPDLLMEPSLGDLEYQNVDLTAALFKDIGWSVNIPGGVVEVIYKNGFE